MTDLPTALSGDRACFGPWLSIGNTLSAELLGAAGYDFAIADLQHGGIGFDALLPVLQALNGGGTPGLVRVPWNDPALIMRALDLGAAGVIVPMVSTPEEARIAAEASRYPPHGIRSFGPVRGYVASGEAHDPLCLVMIETLEAMTNLEAIAATPGINGLLLGPVDLALSMGMDLAAALTMPAQVLDAVDSIVAACRAHGLIASSAALGLPNARMLMERGMRLIGAGADSLFIRMGAAADVREIRSWQADGQGGA